MGRPERVTREQVLAQARRAFAERGFDGTTLADIGARLGVSPAALLRHAPSKEALFALAMESEPADEGLPTDFLASVSAGEDPARVLRRLAREFVPFIELKMGENIARFLRARSEEEARTIRLPFDPRKKSAPPARAIRALEAYLRRAREAGTVSVRNARAAALAFLGSLQSYVFLHRVLHIEPPIPLEAYLDTVIDIWRRGAIRVRREMRGRGER
jgi:AcrR family transcriptional regulator